MKTWEKTRVPGLLRNKSGAYYARTYQNGKEEWTPLETEHFSVAEAQFTKLKAERKKVQAEQGSARNAKLTFGQAAKIHAVNAQEGAKKSTAKYIREIHAAILGSWEGLEGTQVRSIKPKELREWAGQFGREYSATRYNGALTFLRGTFAVAIESGVIYSDPSTGLERKSVKGKILELPTRAQFAAFIEEIGKGHSRDSKNCADLAAGLAYTGTRIGEAAHIEWQHLDFTRERIAVMGDPEERTKNGEIRFIPMLQPARALFERMREGRADEPATAGVFLVHECQHAMDRAAKKVGMRRITHHDLRHFFATVAIESGVDIPTVSRWLGHKDGGALAMKTYGHLRDEHSKAAAKRVSFGAV